MGREKVWSAWRKGLNSAPTTFIAQVWDLEQYLVDVGPDTIIWPEEEQTGESYTGDLLLLNYTLGGNISNEDSAGTSQIFQHEKGYYTVLLWAANT